MAEALTVYEVGPRDGLQGEAALVDVEAKARLIGDLVSAGVRHVEATSFVSPRAVPQMADAAELLPRAMAYPNVRASALVINDKGYARARAAGATAVAIAVVVSEALCARNNRMTVEESLDTAVRIAQRAAAEGVWTRVYVAPAWVCPYEGAVDPDRVIAAAERLAPHCDQLAIADTIGQAHPKQVGSLMGELARRFGTGRLAVHLHDTQGLALANAAAAIAAGVRVVDSSVGGLGGCPFAPGAAGNLATEDLVLMAEKMGFDTGIDLNALHAVVDDAQELVGRALGGRSRSWWTSTRGRSVDE